MEELKVALGEKWRDINWRVTYEAPPTLWCEVAGVKVSFIYRPTPLGTAVVEEKHLRLASTTDITVMKLLAICSREEYKDYFDLACLARKEDVRNWPSYWETVYPEQDLTSWLVALAAVSEVPTIPLIIMGDYLDVNVTDELTRAIREVHEYLKQVG